MNAIRLFLLAGFAALTLSACTTSNSQVPAESPGGSATAGNASHSAESRGTRKDVSQ